MKKQFIETGKIVGTHGIKGEMRMEIWGDSPEAIKDIPALYFDEGKNKIDITARRVHKNLLLITVRDIDSIEKAETLRGKKVYLNRDDVALEEGQHFIADLLGLTARDGNTGKVYGTLAEVFATGANDVYKIVDENKKEYLFPAVPHMIKCIDHESGIIELLPIAGIFDDNSADDRLEDSENEN